MNVTDLRKVITPINPCAGGVGEALRPPSPGSSNERSLLSQYHSF